jgi:broad specificity phosphatase PhoE
MTTFFTMVRHGQTAANAAGILQGQINTELDTTGIMQAECAAAALAETKFDLIFSSDLQRAMHTAQIIGQKLQQPVIPMPELREWDLGNLQGRQVSELQQQYSHILEAFKYDGENFDVPGGERRSEFYARLAECLDHMASEYAGKHLLLVTHAGPMRAVFRHIVGTTRAGVMLPSTVNASISTFCCRDGEWQLRSWNVTDHLAAIRFRDSVTF